MARSIGPKGQQKVAATMREFYKGEPRSLHSGAKTGPVVKSPQQAKAIALSQGRKASRVAKR